MSYLEARNGMWGAIDSQPIYGSANRDGWDEARRNGCVALRSDGQRCRNVAVEGWCQDHFVKLRRWASEEFIDYAIRTARMEDPEAFRFYTEQAALADAYQILHQATSEVYFLTVGDIVKIGHSRNVEGRVRSLKQGSRTLMPEGYDVREAVLLGSIPGGPRVETTIHAQLATYRVVGEWFRITPTVITALDHYLYGGPAPKALEKGLKKRARLHDLGLRGRVA